MTEPSRKKLGLLSPIASREDARSREDALKMIKTTAYWFYFLAALQTAAAFFLQRVLSAEGVIIGVLALVLHTRKSRIAAVLLFLVFLEGVVRTAMNLGMARQEGNNFILAVVGFLASALLASALAVEATFKLHSSERDGGGPSATPPSSVAQGEPHRLTSVSYSAPPVSAERRRIELTRPSAPSAPAKGLPGVRPLAAQPDLARLLRFSAAQCAFDATGLRARTIDGRSCALPWSQLDEVRARILPADKPWDSALIVDFVPVSAEGQPAAPIRLLPLTGMSFRALPGTPAGTRRENLRRLVLFAMSHNPAATIEPESAPFFGEAGECVRFVSISQFSQYDARYG